MNPLERNLLAQSMSGHSRQMHGLGDGTAPQSAPEAPGPLAPTIGTWFGPQYEGGGSSISPAAVAVIGVGAVVLVGAGVWMWKRKKR